MNEGNQTIYNVVPIVTETTGMKRIYISPPVMVEQIAPHNGVKYTANISAGDRIKTGDITIRVAVADGNGSNNTTGRNFHCPPNGKRNHTENILCLRVSVFRETSIERPINNKNYG